MMFVSFDPMMLLFWVFVTCFIPGAVLSFGIFRNSKFGMLEKALIGFGLGIVIVPLIPFLLFFIAGIKYSYAIALFSVAVFYAASIAVFIRSKAHEDFLAMKIAVPQASEAIAYLTSPGFLVPAILIILVLVNYQLRLSTYSPVYMELDPYFYSYASEQIITDGGNFHDDQTAWYPDVTVDHRTVPELSYLEALWNSFYTGGAAFDNMLHADLTSVYPAIASALAIFFVYLFVSAYYRKEWALFAAALAGFIPIYVIKTVSGEMEVQPYAFFAISMFLAFYANMLKDKSRLFACLCALAYVAIALGSSSELVAVTVLLLFIPIQSLFIFFKEKENAAIVLKEFLLNNAIILGLGVFLGAGIVKGLFYASSVSFQNTIAIGMALAIGCALYALRTYVPDEKTMWKAFVALILAGLFVFFFTPLGEVVKDIGAAGLGVARYKAPLERTIAEQGTAGSDFQGEFGFLAYPYPGGIDAVMNLVTQFVNVVLDLTIRFIDWLLDTDLVFDYKANSLLMLFILLFWIALVYAVYRAWKDADYSSHALLFAMLILPPLLIGLLKAKYTIYAGYLLAIGIGFTFGEMERAITPIAEKSGKDESEKKEYASYVYYGLLVIAALIVVLQLTVSYGGIAKSLLASSFQPRFQDDPMALQAKFQYICTELTAKGVTEQSLCDQYRQSGVNYCREAYDPSICSVAADPIGYANQSTNAQFNRKLCYYSVISDIFAPKNEELLAANFRCQRIEDYWIESMEWLRTDTENDSRTTSWWDYGHWINYFGQKNTVLRNEHVSHFMIGEVAHDYVDGSSEDLSGFMASRNSSYALFDMELTGGFPFGGKYGALNYLQCARDNNTNVSLSPGMSLCEAEHLWETVFVPADPTGRSCVISKSGNRTGVIGYEPYWTYNLSSAPFRLSASYPNVLGYNCYGTYLNDPTALYVCQNYAQMRPVYCIGLVTLADGTQNYGTYLLNETAPNGDLMLNRARLGQAGSYPQTYHLGDAYAFELVYDKNPIWVENGQISSGWDDRRTKFYSSNLYQGLYTDDISGFSLVFETKDGQVKIYRTD